MVHASSRRSGLFLLLSGVLLASGCATLETMTRPLPPLRNTLDYPEWHPRGEVAVSVDVQLMDMEGPTLALTLTNLSAEELLLYPDDLPWGYRTLVFVATVGAEHGPVLDYPEDKLCGMMERRSVRIPPGSRKTGLVYLPRAIPGLRDALQRADVFLRWKYKFEVPGQKPVPFEGSLVIPRSKNLPAAH